MRASTIRSISISTWKCFVTRKLPRLTWAVQNIFKNRSLWQVFFKTNTGWTCSNVDSLNENSWIRTSPVLFLRDYIRTLFCWILCSLSSLSCSCIWVPHDSACFLVTRFFSSAFCSLGGKWNWGRLESVLVLFSGDASGDAIILDLVSLLHSPALPGVTRLPGNHTVTYLFANPRMLPERNSGFLWEPFS